MKKVVNSLSLRNPASSYFYPAFLACEIPLRRGAEGFICFYLTLVKGFKTLVSFIQSLNHLITQLPNNLLTQLFNNHKFITRYQRGLVENRDSDHLFLSFLIVILWTQHLSLFIWIMVLFLIFPICLTFILYHLITKPTIILVRFCSLQVSSSSVA